MLAFIPRNLFARTGPGPLGSGLPVWTSRLCLSVACFSSWDSHRSSTPQKKKVRITRIDNTAGVPLTRTKAIGPNGTSHHSFRTLQSVLLCDEIWRFPQPCGKHPARLHVESSNVTARATGYLLPQDTTTPYAYAVDADSAVANPAKNIRGEGEGRPMNPGQVTDDPGHDGVCARTTGIAHYRVETVPPRSWGLLYPGSRPTG